MLKNSLKKLINYLKEPVYFPSGRIYNFQFAIFNQFKIRNLKFKIPFLRKHRVLRDVLGASVLALVLIAVVGYFFPQKAVASWMDESWLYRVPIQVTNSSGSTQTDFQVSFTLDTSSLITAGKMNSSCNDLRVTDISGKILPYWIEENNPGCNQTATKVWVKVPSIATSGQTLYAYYGNASAPSAQAPSKVFDFFDDFNQGSTVNGSRWTTSGSPSISSNALSLTNAKLVSNVGVSTTAGPETLGFRAKTASPLVNTARLGYSDTTNLSNSSYTTDSAQVVMGEEQTYLSSIVPSNEVANYELEETASSTFTPSGYYDTGKSGQAVSTYNSSTLTVPAGSQISGNNYEHIDTNQGTISFWFKPNWSSASDTSTRDLFSATRSARYFSIYKNGSSGLYFQVYNSAQGSQIQAGCAFSNQCPMTAGSWYHIVGTWNYAGNSISLKVNGTSYGGVGTASGTAMATDGNLDIGHRNGGGNASGLIDDFAIWDRVLSSTEITDIYNSGTGKEAGLYADSDLKFYAKMDGTGTLSPVTYNMGGTSDQKAYNSSTNTNGNIITNGDMEAASGGAATSWTDIQGTPTKADAEAGSILFDTRSQKVTYCSDCTSAMEYGQSVTLTGGATYTYSFWYKQSGEGYIYPRVYNTTSSADEIALNQYINATSWTRVETTFKVSGTGAQTVKMGFRKSIAGSNPSTLYLDNVSLTPNSAANGGMEGTYSATNCNTGNCAPSWSFSPWGSATGTASEETTDIHSGTGAQKIVLTANGGGANLISSVSPTSGNWYLVSGWVKGATAGLSFQLGLSTNGIDPQTLINGTTTTTWTRYAIVVKGAGQNRFDLRMLSSGTYYWDDASVVPLDNAPLIFKSSTAANSTAVGSELLTNGNMETGSPPTGWTAYNSSVSADTSAHTGSQDLKITSNGGAQGVAYRGVTLTPGHYYNITAWVKNGSASAVSVYMADDQNSNNAVLYGLPSGADWTQYSGYFTAGAGTDTVSFVCNGASSYCFVDDVSIKEAGDPLSVQGSLTGVSSTTGVHGNGYYFDGSTGYLRQKTIAVNVGSLSYSGNTLVDAGANFTTACGGGTCKSAASPASAPYMIVVTNSDNTTSWGYIGNNSEGSTTITAYTTKATSAAGWNGTSPTGKTPVGYEIRKTDFQITGALTVGAWVKTTDTTSYVIAKGSAFYGSTNLSYGLVANEVNNGNVPVFTVCGSSGCGTSVRQASKNIRDGGWHFLVGVFTPSTNLDIYIDGVLSNGSIAGSIPSTLLDLSNPFKVGANLDSEGTSWSLTGSIDSPFVLNTTLTAAQIAALYNASSTKYTYDNGHTAAQTLTDSGTTIDTSYHTFEITQTASSVIYSTDGSNTTNTTNTPTTSQYIRLENTDASNAVSVDYVYARKYTANAPSAGAAGTEEQSPGPIGYWKFDEGQGYAAKNTAWQKTGTTTNLVTNPSFETNTTGWNTDSANSSIAQVSGGLFGNYAMSVTLSPATAYKGTYVSISTSINTTYTFTTFYKDPNGYFKIQVNGSSSNILSDSNNFSATSAWTKKTVTFTTGATDTSVVIYINTRGTYAGTIYLDGVQLEQASSATPYCDGSLTGNGLHKWNGTAHASTSTCDYGNDGQIIGATWQPESQCISGKCLSFDGTRNYINAGTGSSLNVTGAITLSAWIRPTNLTSYHVIMAKSNGNTAGTQYELRTNGTDVEFLTVNTGTTVYIAKYTGALSLNNWAYVVGDFDGTTLRVYVNGKVGETTATFSGTQVTTTEPFTIATRATVTSAPGAYFFGGFIDEPKVYPYARSAAQVKTDYDAGKMGAANHAGTSTVLGAKTQDYLSNGLVGYWKMDEASWNGTTGEVIDSSGNGNNGQAKQTGTGNGIPTTATGEFGNGGSFTGDGAYPTDTNGQYVQVTSSDSLNTPTSQVTLSAWVNLTSAPSSKAGILTKGTIAGGYSGSQYELRVESDKTVTLSLSNGVDTKQNLTTTSTLPLSTWTHIVATFNNGVSNIYFNGVNQAGTLTGSISTIATSSSDVYIGEDGYNGRYGFTGLMDEIRIYNRALSPSEVSNLYNWAPGPVGYWKMDDGIKGASKTIVDSSGNGNNGTTAGTGIDCSKSPGKYGGSCSFNGTDDHVDVTDPANGSLDFGISSFTISAWIKTSATGAYQDIIDKRSSDGNTGYLLGVGNDNLVWAFVKDGTTAVTTKSSSTVTDGKWHHITATFDRSGNSAVYVDGSPNGTPQSITTVTSSVSNSGNAVIGYYSPSSSGWSYFNGLIDDLKIYNYARTPKQIVSDMNGGHPSVGSPVGSPATWWKFDEGQGQVVNNAGSAGSGYNGTRGADANASTDDPAWTPNAKYGRALSFDGGDYVDTSEPTNLFTQKSFSATFWINVGSATTGETVLSEGAWGAGSRGWNIGFYSINQWWGAKSGYINFDYQFVGSGTVGYAQCNYSGYTSQWVHIAAVRDWSGQTMSLYLNGKLCETRTFSNMQATETTQYQSSLKIGRDSWVASNYLVGSADEVKVYEYPLTADEVKLDMNQGKSITLGAGGTNTTYAQGAANQEYCVPGDSTSCAAPVAEWNFNEGRDNTCAGGSNDVCDTSGNGNDGAWNGTGTKHWVPGKSGWAGNFNGTDDSVAINDLDITGGITIEGWVKTNSTSTQVVARKTNAYQLSVVSSADVGGAVNGSITMLIGTGAAWATTSVYYTDGTTSVADGKWHYVAGTFDDTSDTMKIYVDGVLQTTNTSATVSFGTNNNTLYLGRDVAGSAYPLNGQLDGIRIFNYARTAAQVAYDYNKGGPLAWWKFNECQGLTANDASGNGYSGSISIGGTGTQTSAGTCSSSGTTAWYTGRNGKYGASLNFDGTDDYVNTSGPSTNASTQTYSATGWFYAAGSGLRTIISDSPDANNDYNFRVYVNGSNKLCMHIYNAGDHELCSNKTVSNSTWYNFAAIQDSPNSSRKLYINGVLDTSDSQTSGNFSYTHFHIGNTGTMNSYFNGQIDDVRFYNYALTATQIKNVYNEGFAVRYGPTTGGNP